MIKYEIHEIANCLPEMTDEEFKRLKEDIAGLGVLEPIILLDGKILDGRHRYRACCELGIECPTKVMTDASPNDIVRSLNVLRRHLSASQISMVMTRLKEPFMKEARFRQEQTQAGHAPRDEKGRVNPVVAKLPQPVRGNSKKLYTCSVCAEVFDVPDLGHCPVCDHHYRMGEECSNCHEAKIKKTMVKTTSTMEDYVSQTSAADKKTVEILAEKGGIGVRTMQDALTVDKHGTDEQKKAVVNGKAAVSTVAKEIREEKKAATNAKTMNVTNDNIGWAQYSWNPVTGCNFSCPYCYAKEITDRYFGGDFNPKFHDDRMDMPVNTKPKASDQNNRVFVCSMGELFGEWVPQEWIDKVLKVCVDNPQWTFLFLTKNPKRLPSINFPENSWIGSTIDTQVREDDTAKAMSKMKGMKLFISCEPLLEEVVLSEKLLSVLKLVIIGSKSNGATKEQPKPEWVEKLLFQSRKSNVNVWFKDNLIFRPQETI